MNPIKVDEKYDYNRPEYGGFSGLDRDALQKLVSLVKTLTFEKIQALYGISFETYLQLRHNRFAGVVIPQWFKNRGEMLYTPKLDGMAGSVTELVKPEIVVNGTKVNPWSVEFSIPLIERPWGPVYDPDRELIEPYRNGVFTFSFPQPQKHIPKFKVRLEDVRIVNADDDEDNFKSGNDYELFLGITLYKSDEGQKFSRSDWTLRSFVNTVEIERVWKGLEGVADSPEVIKNWFGVVNLAEVKDVWSSTEYTGDFPREFMMFLVDSGENGFAKMVIEISTLDFGGKVVITPVYSKPLEF
jgi:hypothetical protein